MNAITNETALQVAQLSKRISLTDSMLVLLEGINLSIEQGESVAIVGPSGAGKSTLLGLLAGLDTPTEGQILLHGHDMFALGEDDRAQLRGEFIGFVFQSFQLLPNLTALENVMLPLELIGHKGAKPIAEQVLDRVGLAHRMTHYPRQLSGGEQQRVAIARAYATKPKLLLADEPTGNLDSRTGEDVVSLLFELNVEENTTLILVTHDMGLAEKCQRVLRLDRGQLVAS